MRSRPRSPTRYDQTQSVTSTASQVATVAAAPASKKPFTIALPSRRPAPRLRNLLASTSGNMLSCRLFPYI